MLYRIRETLLSVLTANIIGRRYFHCPGLPYGPLARWLAGVLAPSRYYGS